MCARRRTYLLLLRQKKVGQEKTTPLPVSPLARWASGAACDARAWGVPQNSLRLAFGQTPFKQLRQARQRCACPSARAHPRPCASRHGQKGVGAGSTRAIASLGPKCLAALGLGRAAAPQQSAARSANRPQAQLRSSSRVDPAPQPCWLRREAQGLGWACVPKDTHASSSSLSMLSERSSKNAASSSAPPQGPSIAGCPHRPPGDGGRRLGVVFSLVTFS